MVRPTTMRILSLFLLAASAAAQLAQAGAFVGLASNGSLVIAPTQGQDVWLAGVSVHQLARDSEDVRQDVA